LAIVFKKFQLHILVHFKNKWSYQYKQNDLPIKNKKSELNIGICIVMMFQQAFIKKEANQKAKNHSY